MNEEIARVISGAIVAAGPMGQNVYEWEQKIIAAMPIVATMFDESGTVAKRAEWFDDAHIYSGLFIEARLEESSQRMILRTDPERTKDGVPQYDEIRTDRVDTVNGKRQQGLLAKLVPGDKVLVWRVNEPMRNDAMKNVRVAYLIKRIGRAKDSAGGTPPAPASGQTAERGPHTSTVRPAEPRSDPPRGGASAAQIMKAIPAMPAGTRVKVIAMAKEAGIDISNFMSDDHAFIVEQIIREVERDLGAPDPEEEPF